MRDEIKLHQRHSALNTMQPNSEQPRKYFQFQRIPSEFSLSKDDCSPQPNPLPTPSSTRAREQGAGVTKCKWQKFRGKPEVAARIGERKIAGPCFALVEGVINERHVEITSRPGGRNDACIFRVSRANLPLPSLIPSSNASHRPPLWRSSLSLEEAPRGGSSLK